MRYLCQPCEHTRWWQHRHPVRRMRWSGIALMAVGVMHIVIGIIKIGGQP